MSHNNRNQTKSKPKSKQINPESNHQAQSQPESSPESSQAKAQATQPKPKPQPQPREARHANWAASPSGALAAATSPVGGKGGPPGADKEKPHETMTY